MKVFWNFWIHYYKTNYQWWIIKEKIDGIDNNVKLIMLRIEKIIPILNKLL